MKTFTVPGVRRQLYEYATVDGVCKRIELGHEVADIEISIDVEAVGRSLGKKAMENKSGKSGEINGLVTARVLRRWKEKPENGT